MAFAAMTVTLAVAAAQLTAVPTSVANLTMRTRSTNAGTTRVGDATAQNFEMSAALVVRLGPCDLSTIYARSTNAGDLLDILYVT